MNNLDSILSEILNICDSNNIIEEKTAYHGSQHNFDNFSLQYIGTGEGVQAYGWGLYFTENKEDSEYYRSNITIYKININGINYLFNKSDNIWFKEGTINRIKDKILDVILTIIKDNEIETINELIDYINNKKNNISNISQYISEETKNKNIDEYNNILKYINDNINSFTIYKDEGQIYTVDIPESNLLLDWDLKLIDNPPEVINKLPKISTQISLNFSQKFNKNYQNWTGKNFYKNISQNYKKTSLLLNKFGIPGLQYLDQGSRGNTVNTTHNYVIWNDELIKIKGVININHE
jgi:hypothetical protein